MTFNIRLDAPSDSANNWKYRKDNACKMIAYYQPDLLGMQEVCHNQMEDLKQGLPQYTALGVDVMTERKPVNIVRCSSRQTALHL